MPKVQLEKWGSSLAVRIPKAVAEQAHLREGECVEIGALVGGIELRHAKQSPTLEELVAKITPQNRHKEIHWGPARGKELIGW
jgi:antitoxin MazE